MFITIVFWLGSDRSSGTSFLVQAWHLSILTPSSYLLRRSFILFHSCGSHAPVFGKTLLHEFPISYSSTFFRKTRWSFRSKSLISKINNSNNKFKCRHQLPIPHRAQTTDGLRKRGRSAWPSQSNAWSTTCDIKSNSRRTNSKNLEFINCLAKVLKTRNLPELYA